MQVHESHAPKLKDKHIWVPKYGLNEDIFKLYYRTADEATQLEPVVAAMSTDDLLNLMDDWDPNAFSA